MAVLLALPEEAQVEEAQVEEGLPCLVYLLVWTLSLACLWAEVEGLPGAVCPVYPLAVAARRLVEEWHLAVL